MKKLELKMNMKNKNFWTFFVNNNKLTLILILLFLVFGTFSIFQIKKESAPEVDIPVALISTIYPGASAEDVEELITYPIESKVLSIDEIHKISSVSKNSVSVIIVQFDVKANSNEKIAELKDEVDKAKKDLPKDAEDPRVEKISFENIPIIRYSLTGPYDLAYLKNLADDVKDEFEKELGVSKVEIIGGEEREFQVITKKDLLDKYNISILQVTKAISSANTDIPIGKIEADGENYNIKFNGRIKGVEEIKNTLISNVRGSPVFVKDVAEVVDGKKELDSASMLSLNGKKSMPAVSINVFKTYEADTVEVSKKIEKRLNELKQNYFPEYVEIELIDSKADTIKKDLMGLFLSGIQTIIIVFLILLTFIGKRESVLASLSVPLTFFITFIILKSIGYSLNFITLFSLILALGVLVDSAIVIVEGMNRYIKNGLSLKKAAIETINEFKAPLISGVLTTVVVFLAMLIVSGIVGEFLKPIPITITIVLLSSLFVALSLIPTISVGWRNKKTINLKKDTKGGFMLTKIINFYKSILNKIFYNEKLQKKFTIIIISLFIFSLALPFIGILKIDLFTNVGTDYFMVDIEAPYGTTLNEMRDRTKQVEAVILNDDRIGSIQINIGGKNQTSVETIMAGKGTNYASMIVRIKDKEDSIKITKDLREKFALTDFGTTKINIIEIQAGPPSTAPIEISVAGKNLDELDKISKDFENILSNIPNVTNITTSNVETNGELFINVDRAKAAMYGLSMDQIALFLRNAVNGIGASTINEDGKSFDIVVKSDLSQTNKSNKADINILNSLNILTPVGEIPINTFIANSLIFNRDSIWHEGGDRIVKIYAYPENNVPAASVMLEFQNKVAQYNLTPGYTVKYGGDLEEIEKSFTEMLEALIIGIFAVLMLLVLQLNSFRQSFFIISVIPLTIIGIFPMFVILNIPLSFPAMVGIVALAGIVTNNAIILIDKINKNRLEGMDKNKAIFEATESRIRPIILTTLTTVVGMIPLCFSNPTWAPIAYSVVFGLIFASVLTLIVIPLLYKNFGENSLEIDD